MEEITFYDWLTKNYEGKVGAGGGLFCGLHICLMVIMALAILTFAIIFIKNKKFAFRFCFVVCCFMIIFRLMRMLLELFVIGKPFLEILPWQLCHILAFVFPLYYFTKSEFFVTPVLFLTFFGGVLTFAFGNYYEFNRLSFLDLESIMLHFAMPIVSVGAIISGRLKFKISRFWWQLPIALGVLFGYASLANWLVPGHNYMYIAENGLPFNLFGTANHIFTYMVVAVVLMLTFMLPFLIVKIVKAHKQRKLKNQI